MYININDIVITMLSIDNTLKTTLAEIDMLLNMIL